MWHGTCLANGRTIERLGLNVGTYLTDDEDFAIEYSTVCRHAPLICPQGAVVAVDVDAAQYARPSDGSMGWITTEVVAASSVTYFDWG